VANQFMTAVPIYRLISTLTRARLCSFGWPKKSCLLLAAWLLWVPLTYAQGVGASGVIRGTVTDPTGGVIPNANVTVADALFTAPLICLPANHCALPQPIRNGKYSWGRDGRFKGMG
jgi:hypothetical protein